jgi:hypothetical protein
VTAPRDRLLGVDAARAVALVGMFSTHTLPLRGPDGSESLTGLLADGRSSALFAVLAGVGVALSTPRPPDARSHLAAGVGLLVRGVLVGLLGLALVGLDPPVAVILAYYGLLFVIATPLLRLPAPALAVGAVLVGVGMPFLSHLLRSGLPDGPGEQAGAAALADPGDLLVTLSLTGYYPALPWTAYLLAGMAVGRLDLRRVRVAVALLVGGALLAAVSTVVSSVLVSGANLDRFALLERQYGSTPTDTWWWLAVEIPHSGTPFDLAHTIGTALAVLGLMLLLAYWSRVLVWVPAAVGAIPLTLYTLHVVLLAAYPAQGSGRGTVLLAHLAGAVVIGVGLRAAGRRGPLERIVSGLGGLARGAVGARSAAHRR